MPSATAVFFFISESKRAVAVYQANELRYNKLLTALEVALVGDLL